MTAVVEQRLERRAVLAHGLDRVTSEKFVEMLAAELFGRMTAGRTAGRTDFFSVGMERGPAVVGELIDQRCEAVHHRLVARSPNRH